jgi:uncharacterized membrane protein
MIDWVLETVLKAEPLDRAAHRITSRSIELTPTFSEIRRVQSLVFCDVFRRPLFLFFLLVIVLSVLLLLVIVLSVLLRFTTFD